MADRSPNKTESAFSDSDLASDSRGIAGVDDGNEGVLRNVGNSTVREGRDLEPADRHQVPAPLGAGTEASAAGVSVPWFAWAAQHPEEGSEVVWAVTEDQARVEGLSALGFDEGDRSEAVAVKVADAPSLARRLVEEARAGMAELQAENDQLRLVVKNADANARAAIAATNEADQLRAGIDRIAQEAQAVEYAAQQNLGRAEKERDHLRTLLDEALAERNRFRFEVETLRTTMPPATPEAQTSSGWCDCGEPEKQGMLHADAGCIVVHTATVATASPPEICGRCGGEGQIADSESGEPWSAWAELPPGADLAVKLGVVKPIPCPDCAGRNARGAA